MDTLFTFQISIKRDLKNDKRFSFNLSKNIL